jgi:hypothetical protein
MKIDLPIVYCGETLVWAATYEAVSVVSTNGIPKIRIGTKMVAYASQLDIDEIPPAAAREYLPQNVGYLFYLDREGKLYWVTGEPALSDPAGNIHVYGTDIRYDIIINSLERVQSWTDFDSLLSFGDRIRYSIGATTLLVILGAKLLPTAVLLVVFFLIVRKLDGRLMIKKLKRCFGL